MKLIGELKEKVEAAESIDDVRQAIEDAGMELTDDELDGIAGGYDFQVHHYRYYGEPTGGESEQQPTVFQPVR